MTNNNEKLDRRTDLSKRDRQRLRTATTQYFESLSPVEAAEDKSLVESLSRASDKVNFDEDSEDQATK